MRNDESLMDSALERLCWLASSSGPELSPGVELRSNIPDEIYDLLLGRGLIREEKYRSSETLTFEGVTLTDKGKACYQRLLQCVEEI